LALMRELGQGIDVKQMLNSALYARDVLLVCQAYPDSELPALGRQFSRATAEVGQRAASRGARDSSGFGVSTPAASENFSDFGAFIDSGHGLRQAQRRWLAPSTWFAR
jgi:hypothetical protein